MAKSLALVKRRLSASILADGAELREAVTALKSLQGMTECVPAASGKYICVSYDAVNLQYPALLESLRQAGLLNESGLSWWQRLKAGWYQDQDVVIKENARVKPTPCCSNPTEIMAQSRKRR
jgi:hypothetical protein